MTDLAMLNRLRVNAGKPELKAWKASRTKLDEAISFLQTAGYLDVLPGAKVDVKPITDDPKVAATLPKDEPEIRANPEDRTQSDKAAQLDKEHIVTKVKAKLGRGLETEPMARQSREAVRQHDQEDRAAEKKAKSEARKAEIIAGLKKGQVDPKKDPKKAKRQEEHIAEKKAKREASGKSTPKKSVGDNEITVAQIARELNIDPKIARAKLRRHEGKIKPLHTKGQDRWTFPMSAKKVIIDILK